MRAVLRPHHRLRPRPHLVEKLRILGPGLGGGEGEGEGEALAVGEVVGAAVGVDSPDMTWSHVALYTCLLPVAEGVAVAGGVEDGGPALVPPPRPRAAAAGGVALGAVAAGDGPVAARPLLRPQPRPHQQQQQHGDQAVVAQLDSAP